MASRLANHDLLEAGAREAAEALLRLAHGETARIAAAGVEPVSEVIARAGSRAVVVGFTISGGLTGHFAMVLAESSARALAAEMTGTSAARSSTDKIGKRGLAALTELGNIAASAFMNGAAELLRTSCVPSVPSLAVGDPAQLVPAALGNATGAQVARLVIGEVQVELALVS